ncbi:MAG: Ig-like domain-containing protein [Gemmatimonadaceae bacterium]|nr:Ig-like domain-containing protein [Gemmatimonadaceae bacterium]
MRAIVIIPLVRIVGMLAIGTSTAGSAAAQDTRQPTFFVHGFNSNGESWKQAADRLQQQYAIRTYRPSFQWYQPLDFQTYALRDHMAGQPDTTISIGHSNGGLLARRVNQLRPLKAIATVGTLHRGAPLAQHVLNDNVIYWGRWLGYSVADPVFYYAYNTDDWWWWFAWPYANFHWNVGFGMDAILRYNLGLAFDFTVLRDMTPGSDFLEGPLGVNADWNVAREIASVRRVGITSDAGTALGGLWLAAAPGSWGALTSIQYTAFFIYAAAGDYYLNYGDYNDPYYYEKRAGAWLWYQGAYALWTMDPYWCIFTGAWDNNYGCVPSDAVVPVWSQYYPNALNFGVVGPAHMEEKQSPAVQNHLGTALGFVFDTRTCSNNVASIAVSPTSLTLQPGWWGYVSAVGYNECNASVGSVGASWSSSDPGVASVDASGNVYANAAGGATITATVSGFTARAYVNVQTPDDGGCTDSRLPCEPIAYAKGATGATGGAASPKPERPPQDGVGRTSRAPATRLPKTR